MFYTFNGSYFVFFESEFDVGLCHFIRAALDRAAVLLRMSRWTGLRIDSLWGSGGGQRPVNQLIKEARAHPLTGYVT